jgi:hypothetical protein
MMNVIARMFLPSSFVLPDWQAGRLPMAAMAELVRPLSASMGQPSYTHVGRHPGVGLFFRGHGGWWGGCTARSLYAIANGYNFEAVKIFVPANYSKPVTVPYTEHVPPDATIAIFWMKNQDPRHWGGSQQLEHVFGKYTLSDKPMTEEQWAREAS